MLKSHYLEPLLEQHRKLFYGKAVVMVDEAGNETLYSYDTPIMVRHTDGTYTRIYTGWTQTTGRHIKAFTNGMTKKEFESLPLGRS